MDVPPGTVTSQVNEVPVNPDQEKSAGPDGLLPETTLCQEGINQQDESLVGTGNRPRRRVLKRAE